MKRKHFLLMVGTITLALSSCIKEDLSDPMLNQSIKEVVVADNFNYETFKTVELNLSAPSGGIIEVLSKDKVHYQKAYLNANQTCTMKVSIPTYVSSIRLRFHGEETLIENVGETFVWNFTK